MNAHEKSERRFLVVISTVLALCTVVVTGCMSYCHRVGWDHPSCSYTVQP